MVRESTTSPSCSLAPGRALRRDARAGAQAVRGRELAGIPAAVVRGFSRGHRAGGDSAPAFVSASRLRRPFLAWILAGPNCHRHSGRFDSRPALPDSRSPCRFGHPCALASRCDSGRDVGCRLCSLVPEIDNTGNLRLKLARCVNGCPSSVLRSTDETGSRCVRRLSRGKSGAAPATVGGSAGHEPPWVTMGRRSARSECSAASPETDPNAFHTRLRITEGDTSSPAADSVLASGSLRRGRRDRIVRGIRYHHCLPHATARRRRAFRHQSQAHGTRRRGPRNRDRARGRPRRHGWGTQRAWPNRARARRHMWRSAGSTVVDVTMPPEPRTRAPR